MSLIQGLRLYPKAVLWSVLISTCIAMEGYDVCLVGNFYAFDTFNKKYGELQPDGTYQVPARWQSGLSNGAQCGEIIGLIINGFVSERFGYRYTVMACLVLITGLSPSSSLRPISRFFWSLRSSLGSRGASSRP